jgi:hypothetical protein
MQRENVTIIYADCGDHNSYIASFLEQEAQESRQAMWKHAPTNENDFHEKCISRGTISLSPVIVIFNGSDYHYAPLKQRRALTKKGDARSARLRRCVMHYNVIGDALKCMSLISQYRRCAIQMLVSHHVEKLRRAIPVARLTLDDFLSYSVTNRRRMFSEVRL